MGLFFESQSVDLDVFPTLAGSFHAALLTNLKETENSDLATQMANHMAAQLKSQVQVQTKKFRIWRFVGAVVFLALIFVAAVYCARDDKLQALSQVLVHGFEVLLGAVIGIVIGESSAS